MCDIVNERQVVNKPEILEINNFKVEVEEINSVNDMISISDTNDKIVESVKNVTTKDNRNIVAGIIINDSIKSQMEIDTGASNNIMSYDLFKELVTKLSDKAPKLEAETVIMKMADGTSSMAIKGSSQMKIARADLPSKTTVLKFIKVNGPH